MSLECKTRLSILKDRAGLLKKARNFFDERGITEVDVPILSKAASIDEHIDLIEAVDVHHQTSYLHSSPEYGMKRLLAEGIGDIYQLSHVFRSGESGRKHNPEFMMAEWYRIGFTFEQMIRETADFICIFLGNLPLRFLNYRQAFLHYVHLDYLTCSTDQLIQCLKRHGIETEENEKDLLLNLVLGTCIEPHLGTGELCALIHYPASQAALAKTVWFNQEQVAERFEIYFQGIELANGYHELINADEQRKRLLDANHKRETLGKPVYPIDENFLKALNQGVPDCCGVAVGFDRLMMLHHQTDLISDVIPFHWEIA